MSGAEDTFLARWSRRKQAVKAAQDRAAEEPVSQPAEEAETEAAAESQLRSQDQPATAVAAEPLPSVEELTAESDISGFLRKGVPDALRRAALRKAWSLDPAIRDHIGPAEYAWDYNNPGSIPGFGGNTKSAALDKLTSLVSEGEESSCPAPPPAPPLPTQAVRLASPPARPVPDRDVASDDNPSLPVGGAAAAPVDPAEAGEPPERPAPSRHGGAVPR